MEVIKYFIEFVLHMDVYLNDIISNYGAWTYGILFFIIFMETGFVVTPFLPGDSLLFAAGSFAALGSLNPVYLFILLSTAAVIGDTVNYSIGAYIGPRAFSGEIKLPQKRASGSDTKFLRKTWGQDHHTGPLCSHYPHLRPLCGWYRDHEIQQVYFI